MRRARFAVIATVTVGLLLAGAPIGMAQTEGTIVQDGDNEAEVGQSGELSSGDGAAGSQITGIVAEPGSEVSVRKSNESEDSEATSGEAAHSSTANYAVGPQALDTDTCPTAPVGGTGACIFQDGDNELEATQTGLAATGDAVAGTQVTGAVVSGTLTVDAENTSEGAEATSGDVTGTNFLGELHVGPFLESSLGAADPDVDGLNPLIAATIYQDGENVLVSSQVADGASGDAVAGGQVTGAVVAGTAAITKSNTAEDAESSTGNVDLINQAALDACTTNPDTSELVCGDAVIRSGPWASGTGTISHEGDSEFEDFVQSAEAASGDGVAGGQVTGLVVAETGDAAVDATNDSSDDTATSGEIDLTNTVGEADVACADPGGGAAVCVGADARIHMGNFAAGGDRDSDEDEDSKVAQELMGTTGDAVGGAQVLGGVVAGTLSATTDNTSEDAEATSGDTVGDNRALASAVECLTAGAAALCSDVPDGEFVHEGDDDIEQSGAGATGDAVAGGQVTGAVVAETGDAAIDATNEAEDAEATSGDATSTNLALQAAAECAAATGVTAVPDIDCAASSGRWGDDVEQTQAESTTGDAVAGAQVTGGVVAGQLEVVLGNTSDGDEATSGDAVTDNEQGIAAVACIATNDGGANTALCTDDRDGDALIDGDTGQKAAATTGDAVSGGQVTGAVVAETGDVAIDGTNASEDGEATSGDATSENDAVLAAASCASSDDGTAVACDGADAATRQGDNLSNGGVHTEIDGDSFDSDDNVLDFDQIATTTTGDAVASGQVTGIVSAGTFDGVLSNEGEDAEATSGNSLSENDAALAAALCAATETTAACDAAEGFVQASATVNGGAFRQDGENELEFVQDATAASGDAVGGGQVTGAVLGPDAVATMDATNVSEDAQSESGDANASNTGAVATCEIFVDPVCTERFVQAGARILNGTVLQDGDNTGVALQTADAGSGDAVAGGQVTGMVANGEVDIVIDNTSEDDQTTTGTADHDNLFGNIFFGPIVEVLVP